MTDHTDRRAAERLLADAYAWGQRAEAPTPEVGELTCLAYAAVHALLAIHDALTAAGPAPNPLTEAHLWPMTGLTHTRGARWDAADRYAANEARQREEAEPDPLDEDDHRDRLTADRRRIVRHGRGHWHTPAIDGKWCNADCTERSLQDWNRHSGSLAFAPDTAQEAAGDDLSAPEGESGAEEGGEADNAPEPLLCECGHPINWHYFDDSDEVAECAAPRCPCDLWPSDIARALIEQAVEQAGGGRG